MHERGDNNSPEGAEHNRDGASADNAVDKRVVEDPGVPERQGRVDEIQGAVDGEHPVGAEGRQKQEEDKMIKYIDV